MDQKQEELITFNENTEKPHSDECNDNETIPPAVKITPKIDILLVGLDNAGKTTLLYRLKNGLVAETIQTIGYNVEEFKYKNKNFELWDIGGLKSVRVLKNHFTEGKSFVIYVVDAADPERFDEAQQDLKDFMENKDLQDVNLIVLANKMDLVKDFADEDLIKHLKLDIIKQKWKVHTCSAVTDQEKLWEIFNLL